MSLFGDYDILVVLLLCLILVVTSRLWNCDQRNECGIVIVSCRMRHYGCDILATVTTLRLWHCGCGTVVVTLWLWHFDCDTIVVTLSLWHCDCDLECGNVVATLWVWHYCDMIIDILTWLSGALLIYLTLLWLWKCICCDNRVVTSGLKHCHGNTHTVLHTFFVKICFPFFFAYLVVTILMGFVSRYAQGVIRMRKRVTLMVVTVTVLFRICWVSDIFAHSIDYYTSHSTSKEAYLTIHTLILLNTAVNPFVYALISQNFRQKMKRMLYCRYPGSTGSWSPTTSIPRSRRKSSQLGKNKKGKGTLSHNKTVPRS